MKYFKINCEVPAFYGSKTKFDRREGYLRVLKLHLLFEDWLGSDLMQISPIYFVTTELADELSQSELSGIDGFEDAIVEKHENFKLLHPDDDIPSCKMLKITRNKQFTDFSILNGSLIVSERALDFLNKFNISGAKIYEK